MDGKTLTRVVEKVLLERGLSRNDLCKAIGISSAAYTGWKNGSQPRADKVAAIEKWLGIDLSEYEPSKEDELREMLREDLRILLRSAQDLPPSSVYQLISQIEKEKENAN